VLFFLSNLASYPDRVALLQAIARRIGRLVLLTGASDDVAVDKSPLEIIPLGFRKGRRVGNILTAQRAARHLVRTRGIQVVQDTSSTLFPVLPGLRMPDRVVRVESLFTLVTWRLRNVWSGVPVAKMLRQRETAFMYYNAVTERLAIRSVDHVVLQAPGLIDWLTSFASVAPERIHILTNSVDTDFWSPSEPRNPPSLPLRILFAGGIDRTRGIFHLLMVVAALRHKGIPTELTLAGNFNPIDEEDVGRAIKDLGLAGDIKALGSVSRERLRSLFAAHDMFIYQSVNEGSPRAVLEAMSSGIPIIASTHPGIQVLDPEGSFIHFSHFGEVPRITKMVESFLQNPLRWIERAAEGRAYTEKHFATDVVADSYVRFYDRVVSG
jgi:glycosyltransferase involved in cell wall biosynthesis